MACTEKCRRPTPSQAHCAADGCHRTFGGVTGFDEHRKYGECVDPAQCGMVETDGLWRRPVSEADRERVERLRGAA